MLQLRRFVNRCREMVNGSPVIHGQVRLHLLRALEAGSVRYISGEDLSRCLSVSRTSIWTHVRALRGQGYCIESLPHCGYRLISCPDTLVPLEVRKQLDCRVLGREVHCFAEVGSTQDEAFRMAQKGAPEGTLVIAEQQAGGRGRVGRAFFHPWGLWFSFILRPQLRPQLCLPAQPDGGRSGVRSSQEFTGLPRC